MIRMGVDHMRIICTSLQQLTMPHLIVQFYRADD